MGERDHSITCETCGLQRGGLNDYKCDCDIASSTEPQKAKAAMQKKATKSLNDENRSRLIRVSAALACAEASVAMLTQAAEILKNGADIHPGWSGVLPDNHPAIKSVEVAKMEAVRLRSQLGDALRRCP